MCLIFFTFVITQPTQENTPTGIINGKISPFSKNT